MSRPGLLLAVVLASTTAACATGPVPSAAPTLENLQALRRGDLVAMKVGEFALAPGKPQGMDGTIVVRAGTMSPPKGGSFSGYLGETLATELGAAGKLDSASPVVVSGLLSQSSVSSELPTGHAALGAIFTVTRDGTVVYRKELSVSSQWQSEFIGAVAIPQAMGEYTGLYNKLVGALLADPEFRAAVQRR